MMARSTHTRPRDRRDDESLNSSTSDKPAILGRVCQRLACIGALALVVYGTLGPLGYRGGGGWLASAGQWRWALLSLPCDFNDVLTNLLVYIPVGLAMRLLLRRRGRAGMRDLAVAMGFAVALSYATELLQQFMPARSSNLNDVGVNAIGALIGCIIAPYSQRIARAVHSLAFANIRGRRWTVAAGAAVLAACVVMTAPWNLTSPTFELSASRPLAHTDFARLGMFAVLGLLIVAAVGEHVRSADRSLFIAIACTVALAALIEFAQAFIGARLASMQHLLIACVGGLAGIAVGALRHRVRIGPIAGGLALLATISYLLVMEMTGTQHALTPGLSAVEWRLPFQTLFMLPIERVMVDVLESLVLYGFLTGLSLRLAARAKAVSALVLLGGLVGTIQCFRLTFAGGVFDTTPFVIALCAWAVTCYAWTALRKQTQTAG